MGTTDHDHQCINSVKDEIRNSV